ncbi:MAG: tetratricopeptide repeat protein [Eubacteriaceae bacterium]|nr:tetratricopeptide repeat protein [Eubacteriaceae bacterium]
MENTNLDNANSEQLLLIGILSLLADCPISETTALDWLELDNEAAIEELENLGAIEKKDGQITLAQSARKEAREKQPPSFEQLKDFLASILWDLDNKKTSLDTILPHVASIWDSHAFDGNAAAALAHSVGYRLFTSEKANEALGWFFKELETNEKLYGEADPIVADSLHSIGSCYREMGELGLAMEWYSKSLSVFEAAYGPEHGDVALLKEDIGALHKFAKEYQKALELFLDAFATREKLHGLDHPNTISACMSAAITYADLEEAEQFNEWFSKGLGALANVIANKQLQTAYDDPQEYAMEREGLLLTVEICRNVLSGDHVATAAALYNLGEFYLINGQYPSALDSHLESYGIREKLSVGDIESALSAQGVADAYMALEDFDNAIEYLARSIESFKPEKGANSEEVAMCLLYTARAYNKKEDYQASLDNMLAAYEILEALGDTYPVDKLAVVAQDVGFMHGILHDHETSADWFEKSFEMLREAFGRDNLDTANAARSTGIAYMNQDKHELALGWLEISLRAFVNTLGPDHVDNLTLYRDVISLCISQGKYDKGLEWLLKEHEALKAAKGEENSFIAISCNQIGVVYTRLEKYPDALEWLEKALGIAESVLAGEDQYTYMALSNIASVYSSSKDYSKAIDSLVKALEFAQASAEYTDSDAGFLCARISNEFAYAEDFATAIEWMERALEFIQSNDENIGDASDACKAIASLQATSGNHAKAAEWLARAFEIYSPDKESFELAMDCINISDQYNHAENYVESLVWLKKSLAILEKVGGPQGDETHALVCELIAKAYENTKEPNLAVKWRQRALLASRSRY